MVREYKLEFKLDFKSYIGHSGVKGNICIASLLRLFALHIAH